MEFEYDETANITDVDANKTDKCVECIHLKDAKCILVACIQCHAVYPAAEKITIKYCGMFKSANTKTKKHIRQKP